MPNWCYTTIHFHGNGKEIEDFYEKIEAWTSKELRKTDFGPSWLGNILIGAGLGDRIDASSDEILRCRGRIEYIDNLLCDSDDDDDATFTIETETAWIPMLHMWDAVIEKMGYKTIGYSYMAEEPGCELYWFYDPYGDFHEAWYVDVLVEGDDTENEALMDLYDTRYYSDDNSLRVALTKLLGTLDTNINNLVDRAQNFPFKSEDSYISIHKYKEMKPEEIEE